MTNLGSGRAGQRRIFWKEVWKGIKKWSIWPVWKELEYGKKGQELSIESSFPAQVGLVSCSDKKFMREQVDAYEQHSTNVDNWKYYRIRVKNTAIWNQNDGVSSQYFMNTYQILSGLLQVLFLVLHAFVNNSHLIF